jgi:hypothetical protein
MTPRVNINREEGVMARKTAIRTTIEPGVVIKVDDTELLDLDRQGLIKSREGDEGWHPEAPEPEVEAPAPTADTKKKGA